MKYVMKFNMYVFLIRQSNQYVALIYEEDKKQKKLGSKQWWIGISEKMAIPIHWVRVSGMRLYLSSYI